MIHVQEHVFYETPFGKIARFTVLECVIGVCLTVMTGLLQLPYEYIDEYPVPTIVFKGRPHTFHAFVLCVVSAFMTATKAFNSPNTCKTGNFCVFFSVASIVSAFLVVLWAVLCSCTS